MKKSFRLSKGKHAPARVIDGIKAKLNKHIKQERQRELPEDFDFWDFDCKIGVDQQNATDVHVSAIGKAVDAAAAASQTDSIYVAIQSVAKLRHPDKLKAVAKESADKKEDPESTTNPPAAEEPKVAKAAKPSIWPDLT